MSVFRVIITGLQYGNITIQNVLHFNWPDFVGTELTVAQEVRDGWCSLAAVSQVSSFGWRNVSVYKIGSHVTPTNLPIIVGGGDIGDPNNSMSVLALKFRIHTPRVGRKGRGRIYMPAIRQAHWQFNQLTSAGQTTWNARLAALKGRYLLTGGTGPMFLGVMNRGEDPTEFTHADDLTYSLIPGIQRRRNLNVGI